MNVFVLSVLTSDFTNGETDVQFSVYSSKEKAKEAFDTQYNKEIDTFEDLGEDYSVDSAFPEDMPDEDMTDENCLSICIHNDSGLYVTIEVEEKPVE